MKRMRGRNHRGGGGGPVRHQTGNVPMNRNHVFDSSGPDLRIRGTSQQLFEKYLQLGRDATGAGDRVMAESYFQHAEHYFRILNAMNQAAQQSGQANGHGGQSQQRRTEQGGEASEQAIAYDAEQPALSEDQPIVETRPIAITAGAPEGE